MTQYNVAALVMINGGPATPIAAARTGNSGPYVNIPAKGASKLSPSGIASLAGYPDLSAAIGMIDGLPTGLSLAYAFARAVPPRVPPTDCLMPAAKAEQK